MHKFRPKQAVVPAHVGPEATTVCEVVALLAIQARDEPQYRIKERESGMERTVSEREIKSLFEEPEATSRSA